MSPPPRIAPHRPLRTLWTAIRAWRWFAVSVAFWTTALAALIIGEVITKDWMVFVAGPGLFFFFAFVYWLAGRGSQ